MIEFQSSEAHAGRGADMNRIRSAHAKTFLKRFIANPPPSIVRWLRARSRNGAEPLSFVVFL